MIDWLIGNFLSSSETWSICMIIVVIWFIPIKLFSYEHCFSSKSINMCDCIRRPEELEDTCEGGQRGSGGGNPVKIKIYTGVFRENSRVIRVTLKCKIQHQFECVLVWFEENQSQIKSIKNQNIFTSVVLPGWQKNTRNKDKQNYINSVRFKIYKWVSPLSGL